MAYLVMAYMGMVYIVMADNTVTPHWIAGKAAYFVRAVRYR